MEARYLHSALHDGRVCRLGEHSSAPPPKGVVGGAQQIKVNSNTKLLYVSMECGVNFNIFYVQESLES